MSSSVQIWTVSLPSVLRDGPLHRQLQPAQLERMGSSTDMSIQNHYWPCEYVNFNRKRPQQFLCTDLAITLNKIVRNSLYLCISITDMNDLFKNWCIFKFIFLILKFRFNRDWFISNIYFSGGSLTRMIPSDQVQVFLSQRLWKLALSFQSCQ